MITAPSIKVLVSTKTGQGIRPSDFSWTEEGEVVYFGFVCDRDAKGGNPDGGCGCGRAMVGALSSKATTTFTVALWPKSEKEFLDYVLGALQDAGWLGGMDEAGRAEMLKDARELLRIAALFPVGAVLEKRGSTIQQRRPDCAKVRRVGA